MTPEERLQREEELAYEQELKAQAQGGSRQSVPVEEEPVAFDDNQVETQLKQATLSAESCPEVVTEDKSPAGETAVTLSFSQSGDLAELTIPPPFSGTRMGDCVLNAYRNIKAPPYRGPVKVITWPVSLKRPKK